MKTYKLIKEYPGSPKLGTIRNPQTPHNLYEVCIEQPEFWEEVVEKEYEILSIMPKNEINFKGIIFSHNCSDLLNYLINGDYRIQSVKRLSDGEVFTIGDKLETGIIKEFYLPSGPQKEVTIYVTKDDEDTYLSEARHIKTPLFTTEDGVDVFRGNTYYRLNVNLQERIETCFAFKGEKTSCFHRYFSTEKAAEKYILMNKPCLSLNDVASVYITADKICKPDDFRSQSYRIQKLVKEKLKN